MVNVVEILNDLCAYDKEREWFEFKENWFEPTELGEYIAALSNSAAMEGRSCGYFATGGSI